MKSPLEIQRAHDQLVGIVLQEVPLPIDVSEHRLMRAALDVLCWVLDHDHNVAFAENLTMLEERCREIGFALPPLHQPSTALPEVPTRCPKCGVRLIELPLGVLGRRCTRCGYATQGGQG